MNRFRKCLPVLTVFLLALLVRIVYNLTTGHNYIPKDDAALYNNLALGMLAQHCYCFIAIHHANISRAPLWPFVIAAIYFTGPHELYSRLFYCVLGSTAHGLFSSSLVSHSYSSPPGRTAIIVWHMPSFQSH